MNTAVGSAVEHSGVRQQHGKDEVFTNARIVLDDDVIDGSLLMSDGLVKDVQEGRSRLASAIDCEGDYLVAGLVEIHTDALEWHLRPRKESPWPASAALVGHDAVLAASGITTVLDSLCIGDLGADGFRSETLISSVTAIESAQMSGDLRVDHLLHFRCEVADPRTPSLFDELSSNPLLRLVSLMDHTPGGRQYRDVGGYRASVLGHPGASDVEIDARISRLLERQAEHAMPNWTYIADAAASLGLPLASHDDATLEDIELAVANGVTIAEFPTTEVAARAARRAGLVTAAGAPNIVRGGSHSGNVSATSLATWGLLDIVTSDYVPYSLLHAPFLLATAEVMPLPHALSLVSAGPARAVGLTDRGQLVPGKRADFLRVRLSGGLPVVRSVFRGGTRIG